MRWNCRDLRHTENPRNTVVQRLEKWEDCSKSLLLLENFDTVQSNSIFCCSFFSLTESCTFSSFIAKAWNIKWRTWRWCYTVTDASLSHTSLTVCLYNHLLYTTINCIRYKYIIVSSIVSSVTWTCFVKLLNIFQKYWITVTFHTNWNLLWSLLLAVTETVLP